MSAIVKGLRNIVLHRGASVTRTVSLTVTSKADITHIAFSDPKVYSKQPEKQKEAFVDATKYSALSGLDAAGAVSADLALVLFVTPLWCFQSDQSCPAEVSTLAERVLTRLSV